jgi:hypothetical protein
MKPLHMIHAAVTLLLLCVILAFGVLVLSGVVELRIAIRGSATATQLSKRPGETQPNREDPVATQALLKRVGEAVRAGRVSTSQQMGTGAEAYDDVPKDGALLIGFEVTYGRYATNPTIKTVRPLFLTPNGKSAGTTHGVPGDSLTRVEAKAGYAVGAVTIKAGLGVDGMSVTFMQIGEKGLNPNESYESEWLGGLGGADKTKLGGSGALVIGIFGKTAEAPESTFNGLGLVMALKEE